MRVIFRFTRRLRDFSSFRAISPVLDRRAQYARITKLLLYYIYYNICLSTLRNDFFADDQNKRQIIYFQFIFGIFIVEKQKKRETVLRPKAVCQPRIIRTPPKRRYFHALCRIRLSPYHPVRTKSPSTEIIENSDVLVAARPRFVLFLAGMVGISLFYRCFTGKIAVTRKSFPLIVSAFMLPPWISVIAFAIESPMPCPPVAEFLEASVR